MGLPDAKCPYGLEEFNCLDIGHWLIVSHFISNLLAGCLCHLSPGIRCSSRFLSLMSANSGHMFIPGNLKCTKGASTGSSVEGLPSHWPMSLWILHHLKDFWIATSYTLSQVFNTILKILTLFANSMILLLLFILLFTVL